MLLLTHRCVFAAGPEAVRASDAEWSQVSRKTRSEEDEQHQDGIPSYEAERPLVSPSVVGEVAVPIDHVSEAAASAGASGSDERLTMTFDNEAFAGTEAAFRAPTSGSERHQSTEMLSNDVCNGFLLCSFYYLTNLRLIYVCQKVEMPIEKYFIFVFSVVSSPPPPPHLHHRHRRCCRVIWK